MRLGALVCLLSCSVGLSSAGAQTRPPVAPQPRPAPPRAPAWELSGGAAFVGGYDLGTSTAGLTRNTLTAGAGTFALFTGDSSVGGVSSVFGRIGYYLTPRLAVEGSVRFGRPVFQVELSGDAENAPDIVAEERLDQYVFGGSVLWHFGRVSVPGRAGARLVPFVYGGAGYLRELHESQELVETGAEYHTGVGIKYWLGTGRRRLGIRGEGGLSVRDGGFDFEEELRPVPMASVSLVYLF